MPSKVAVSLRRDEPCTRPFHKDPTSIPNDCRAIKCTMGGAFFDLQCAASKARLGGARLRHWAAETWGRQRPVVSDDPITEEDVELFSPFFVPQNRRFFSGKFRQNRQNLREDQNLPVYLDDCWYSYSTTDFRVHFHDVNFSRECRLDQGSIQFRFHRLLSLSRLRF